jgi:hypothetical protein
VMLHRSGGLVSRETAALFVDALWPMFESLHDALAPPERSNEGGGGQFLADFLAELYALREHSA